MEVFQHVVEDFQRYSQMTFQYLGSRLMYGFRILIKYSLDVNQVWLRNLDKVLTRCEYTNLVLKCQKCHLLVRKGILLGHKVSKTFFKWITPTQKSLRNSPSYICKKVAQFSLPCIFFTGDSSRIFPRLHEPCAVLQRKW